MLDKLAGITSLAVSKPMMAVLLKLFGYCVKLGSNRQLLLSLEMGTTPVLLNTLKLCLAAGETLMTTGEMSSTIWEPGVRSSDMCNLVAGISCYIIFEGWIILAVIWLTKRSCSDYAYQGHAHCGGGGGFCNQLQILGQTSATSRFESLIQN